MKTAQAATTWSQWLTTSWPWPVSWLPQFFLHKQSSDIRWARQGMMVEVRTGFKSQQRNPITSLQKQIQCEFSKVRCLPGMQGGENPDGRQKKGLSEANIFQIWFSKLTVWHYLEKGQRMLLYLWEFLSSKERRKWRTKNSSQNWHTSEILWVGFQTIAIKWIMR